MTSTSSQMLLNIVPTQTIANAFGLLGSIVPLRLYFYLLKYYLKHIHTKTYNEKPTKHPQYIDNSNLTNYHVLILEPTPVIMLTDFS